MLCQKLDKDLSLKLIQWIIKINPIPISYFYLLWNRGDNNRLLLGELMIVILWSLIILFLENSVTLSMNMNNGLLAMVMKERALMALGWVWLITLLKIKEVKVIVKLLIISLKFKFRNQFYKLKYSIIPLIIRINSFEL